MVNTCFTAPHHPSIPEKVYNLLIWLTDPDSHSALVLYGPGGSGKSIALQIAIQQLAEMSPLDRHIPKEVFVLEEGHTSKVFSLSENTIYDYEENILDSKTIIVVTSDRLPGGMAELLCAHKMKFERE